MSLAAVGLDLSSGAPASVITRRRMRCSWPGCPPRSGTRCGSRDKATQRGSRLTQQLAPIWPPRMPRNVAAMIQTKIKALVIDPYSAANVKKLTGERVTGYVLVIGVFCLKSTMANS